MTRVCFIFCQFFSKNEEKPCHGNLRMSRPQTTYGSVSEAGEFGLNNTLQTLKTMYAGMVYYQKSSDSRHTCLVGQFM